MVGIHFLRRMLHACVVLLVTACTTAPDSVPDATSVGSASAGGRGNELVTVTVADRVSPHYRFERHYLDSADALRHYRIDMAIPRAAAPEAGYPVLYMLDGNAAMATLTNEDLRILAGHHPPPVLVAIGYDVPTRNDVVSRAYDYTPPLFKTSAPPVVRGRIGGGSAIFLQFITSRVKPLVRSRADINTEQELLWGHSYGGLFTLYALFTQPQEFAHYVAGDPSFWWHNGAILQHWQRFEKSAAAGKRLAILIGTKARERAASAPTPGPAETDAVDRLTVAQEMVEQLRQHGARANWHIFPQYGHGEMIRTSLEYALFSVY